jgi:hypothetical protein
LGHIQIIDCQFSCFHKVGRILRRRRESIGISGSPALARGDS